MFRLALVLLGLGLFVGYLGIKETRLWVSSSGTPTELTMDELVRNGVGNNRNLRISEFLFSPSFVYTQRSNDKSSYTAVYVPVLSPNSAYAQQLIKQAKENIRINIISGKLPELKGDFPLLMKSTTIKNDTELGVVGDGDVLEGLVINSVESLGSKESRFLRESFPGMDLDKVVILEHGRKPTGFFMLLVYYGGSLLLMAAGVGVGFKKLSTAGQQG